MRVLGIDPGTRVTGYGVVEKGKRGSLLHLLDGDIRLDPEAPLSERLVVISERLGEIMRELAPEAVAVESVFFSKNARSAAMLGHVRGVVLMCAASMGIEAFEYSPRSIKESVVGYGAATKDQVQKMVRVLLGKNDFSMPDAADALACAICHIHTNGPRAKTVRT